MVLSPFWRITCRVSGTQVTEGGVTIIGAPYLASEVTNTASNLLARNVADVLAHFVRDGKLAMDLNMNQNSISRYENGEREADYAALIRFADYFDVSVDYLLGRTDNPKMNR